MIRPIRSSAVRVNQSARSGPAVICDGRQSAGCNWCTSTTRSSVTRAIWPACTSVTQSAPSGPVVSAYGPAPAAPTVTSSTVMGHSTIATARVGPPCAPCSLSGNPTKVNRVFTTLSRLARFS